MKIFKVFFVVAIISVIGVFAYEGIVNAQSTSVTESQASRIRTNCISAKNTLGQIHASDGLLRVNRGQIYESMSTKLMSRFNSRASSNRYDIKDLTSVTQNYDTILTSFRNNYRAYEEQLSKSLAIDCSKDPVGFYESVSSSRAKRMLVHADVVRLHQYIDEYEAAFDKFVTEFKSRGGIN